MKKDSFSLEWTKDEIQLDDPNEERIVNQYLGAQLVSSLKLTPQSVESCLGMKVKCIIQNRYEPVASEAVGFLNDFSFTEWGYVATISTYKNLNEETHQLEGDDESRYEMNSRRIILDRIKRIDALLFSNPRWQGVLTNYYHQEDDNSERLHPLSSYERKVPNLESYTTHIRNILDIEEDLAHFLDLYSDGTFQEAELNKRWKIQGPQYVERAEKALSLMSDDEIITAEAMVRELRMVVDFSSYLQFKGDTERTYRAHLIQLLTERCNEIDFVIGIALLCESVMSMKAMISYLKLHPESDSSEYLQYALECCELHNPWVLEVQNREMTID